MGMLDYILCKNITNVQSIRINVREHVDLPRGHPRKKERILRSRLRDRWRNKLQRSNSYTEPSRKISGSGNIDQVITLSTSVKPGTELVHISHDIHESIEKIHGEVTDSVGKGRDSAGDGEITMDTARESITPELQLPRRERMKGPGGLGYGIQKWQEATNNRRAMAHLNRAGLDVKARVIRRMSIVWTLDDPNQRHIDFKEKMERKKEKAERRNIICQEPRSLSAMSDESYISNDRICLGIECNSQVSLSVSDAGSSVDTYTGERQTPGYLKDIGESSDDQTDDVGTTKAFQVVKAGPRVGIPSVEPIPMKYIPIVEQRPQSTAFKMFKTALTVDDKQLVATAFNTRVDEVHLFRIMHPAPNLLVDGTDEDIDAFKAKPSIPSDCLTDETENIQHTEQNSDEDTNTEKKEKKLTFFQRVKRFFTHRRGQAKVGLAA